jgi:hypothetical protein
VDGTVATGLRLSSGTSQVLPSRTINSQAIFPLLWPWQSHSPHPPSHGQE